MFLFKLQKVPKLVGDSEDEAFLASLAKRTKVVVTTVGPYTKVMGWADLENVTIWYGVSSLHTGLFTHAPSISSCPASTVPHPPPPPTQAVREQASGGLRQERNPLRRPHG